MNAQAILDKIQVDAREAASMILNDANDRAATTQKNSEEKVARMRADTEKRAKSEGVEMEQRMHRMAELERKKLLLGVKREMIAQVFQLALEKMKCMPKTQAQKFLLSIIEDAAQGQETIIVGGENDTWFTPDFLDQANAALVKQGKPGALTVANEKRPGVCGLVLSHQDMEINCTFEALINAKRLDMEGEVANTLFP